MKNQLDSSSLELNKEFLASLINTDDLYMNAPCGYLSFHPDGTIIKINRTLCNWLRYDEFDILYKKSFTDLLSKGGAIYYEMVYIPLLKMQGYANEINFDIERADHSSFPALVNAVLLKDKHENIRAINVTIFDITDRKKYEAELLNAKKEADNEKKRFELLADLTPDIIFTATPEGVIEYANQRFYEYFNLSSKNFNQRLVLKRIHPSDKIRCFKQWMNAIMGGSTFETEIRLKNAFGNYIWHLVRAVPYTNDATSVLKFFGSCTNIQEQKELQSKKDEFISVASHELKTPLSSLKGYIQIIKKERTDPLFSNILNRCIKAVNNMQYLVSSLLDVSRIQAGQLSLQIAPASLYNLILECIELTDMNYSSHHIHLIFDVDMDIKVWMDAQRIQQVIINLLSNGIKYSPGAKEVVLRVEKQPHKRAVKISVQDFGIGIPAEEVKHVFEKYYRVKDAANQISGLGIGLYLIKEIIQLHKGNIFIESEINKGSTFYFYLPVAE
ncbi:PAS domain-containing sensor histidine kinase [Ilyomonas limi]|uniref:histidine kinase n=1 Tax=Ilyomonas limi TaxID=2575867 RepID=A0A4U3KVZ3_9BACT|nr:PAS domain-containing sensor histidine kinase [Ilyomonas limi]TKK66668.1 PAS domain-containing sensor histidine kinase [Ilyomonas limi]